MNAGNSPLAKNLDIIVREPECVSCNYIRTENAEIIKILYRRLATMEVLAILDFLLCFAEVNMNLETTFTCKFR